MRIEYFLVIETKKLRNAESVELGEPEITYIARKSLWYSEHNDVSEFRMNK